MTLSRSLDLSQDQFVGCSITGGVTGDNLWTFPAPAWQAKRQVLTQLRDLLPHMCCETRTFKLALQQNDRMPQRGPSEQLKQ